MSGNGAPAPAPSIGAPAGFLAVPFFPSAALNSELLPKVMDVDFRDSENLTGFRQIAA